MMRYFYYFYLATEKRIHTSTLDTIYACSLALMGKRHYHDPDLLEQIFFLNDRGSHIRFKQFLGASVVRVI